MMSDLVRLPMESFAPSLASSKAIPNPSPLLDAATIAIFPLSFKSIASLSK
jgi:hypothetical protein